MTTGDVIVAEIAPGYWRTAAGLQHAREISPSQVEFVHRHPVRDDLDQGHPIETAMRIDPKLILPIMENSRFEMKFFPKVTEARLRGKNPDLVKPVFRQFSTEMVTSYGIPRGKSYRSLTISEAAELGLGIDALHELALENLERAIADYRIYRFASFFGLHTLPDLAASTLLLPALWDEIATRIRGELRVAVPGRSMVAFTGTQTPGDHEGIPISPDRCIAMLANSADMIYQQERIEGRELSHHLLLRDGLNWRMTKETLWELCKDVDVSLPPTERTNVNQP